MATTYLTRAMNGNSEYTGTISLWLKRTNLGQHVIFLFGKIAAHIKDFSLIVQID